MPKQPSKSKDIDQITATILEDAVGEPAPMTAKGRRNPAAVSFRRSGAKPVSARTTAAAAGRRPAKVAKKTSATKNPVKKKTATAVRRAARG